ncbi:uncharacterized protein LOC131034982 [Cryptomeria japonica]|uniref:uncharacterized protein LOC131034982 n=1 Tax=Cryptomeria japonica TaxID=3369 RepID=UPI0025AC58AE|nr:uncharacterized protein LOC131034982 [Cryptomeria japonica]
MAEAFSRIIKSKHGQGLWRGARIEGTSVSVTHSLFVDATLLFGKSNVQEAKHIRQTLDLYMAVSSQRINAQKSKIYVFNTNDVITRKNFDTLGFSQECLPTTYLGIPFFVGANKLAYWKVIIDRIKNAISTWKARWLSLSGRLLLIKIVLSSIPNYFMSALKAPAGVIHHIEKLIRSFLWRDNMSEEKKIPLISI